MHPCFTYQCFCKYTCPLNTPAPVLWVFAHACFFVGVSKYCGCSHTHYVWCVKKWCCLSKWHGWLCVHNIQHERPPLGKVWVLTSTMYSTWGFLSEVWVCWHPWRMACKVSLISIEAGWKLTSWAQTWKAKWFFMSKVKHFEEMVSNTILCGHIWGVSLLITT